MKKFIAILSHIGAITAMADTKSLEQGFYKVKDAGLATGSAYKVRNASPTGRAIVMVFDSNQLMQEFLRLEPNSQSFILKPLDFDYIVIIVGGGKVEFS
jgi:hypothetical protein